MQGPTPAQRELPESWQVLLVESGDARILAAAEPTTGPVWTGSLTITAKTGIEQEGTVQLVALGASLRIRIAAVGFATRAACAAALRDGIVLDVAATMVVVPPMPGGATVDRLRLVCDGEPDWLASNGPVIDGSVWLPLHRGGYTATGFAAGPATAGQSTERQAIGRLVVGDGATTVVWAVELPGAHALYCRIVDASQQPAPGVQAHFRYLGSPAGVRHDGWTEARSDEDGRIRITGLLAGDYSVTIRGQDQGQQATYRVAVPGTAALVLPAANRILLDYAFPLAGLVDGMDEPRVWLRTLGTTGWRPAGTTVDYFAAVGVLRAVEPGTHEFAATATAPGRRPWRPDRRAAAGRAGRDDPGGCGAAAAVARDHERR